MSLFIEFTHTNRLAHPDTTMTLTHDLGDHLFTTVRNGGAVRFESGKIIQTGFGGKPFLSVNSKGISWQQVSDADKTLQRQRDAHLLPVG